MSERIGAFKRKTISFEKDQMSLTLSCPSSLAPVSPGPEVNTILDAMCKLSPRFPSAWAKDRNGEDSRSIYTPCLATPDSTPSSTFSTSPSSKHNPIHSNTYPLPNQSTTSLLSTCNSPPSSSPSSLPLRRYWPRTSLGCQLAL